MKTMLLFFFFLSINIPSVLATEQRAVFAGGCFWCMEKPFEELAGVNSVKSGYIGGSKANPTYEEVSAGSTGHTEAIEVIYNSRKISYAKLLDVFWKNIDPLDHEGQFCDKGDQYKSGIFTFNETQKKLAEESLKKLKESPRFKGEVIATYIKAASAFYPAEEYHQDYYKINPIRYKYYRYRCGRDERLEKIWKK